MIVLLIDLLIGLIMDILPTTISTLILSYATNSDTIIVLLTSFPIVSNHKLIEAPLFITYLKIKPVGISRSINIISNKRPNFDS